MRLKHLAHAIDYAVRKLRSPAWRRTEKAQLRIEPTCRACGTTAKLQVHHIAPFHLFPEKELDPKNLITLCMGPLECHFEIGHHGNWKDWNPNVRADAARALDASRHSAAA